MNTIKTFVLGGIIIGMVSCTGTNKSQLVGAYSKSSKLLTSSSCHPKFFVKEFCYFLMSCHQHCLGINLLVQR